MFKKIKERIQKYKEPFERWLPPVRLGIILLAFVTIFTLFVPPANGPFDDGTYNMILHANGLREFMNDPNYYKYFVPQFPILQYYNPDSHMYLSLQNILIQAAIFLNKIFYSTKIFDVRFLGAVYTVLFLGGARMLFKGLSHNLKGFKAYLMVMVGVFLLGDTTYTVYFNSFYVEPLDFIMMIYFVAFGLRAFQQTDTRKVLKYYSGQVLIAFLLMFVSKQVSFLLSALCFSLIGGIVFIKGRQWKLSAIILVSALVPLSLFIGSLYSNPQHNENIYQTMTLGAMPASKEPSKALAKIDVDPQNEILRGTSYSAPYAIARSNSATIQKDFIDELNYGKLVYYYLSHPSVASNLLQMGLENKNVSQIKVSAYEKGAVKKGDEDKMFFQWGTIVKGAFLPKKFGFYILFAILVVSIYSVSMVRGMQMGSRLYLSRWFMNLGLLAMMFMSFFSPIIVSGETNLTRQLTMSSVLLDLLLLLIISDSLHHNIWINQETVLIAKAGGEDDDQQKSNDNQ